MMDGVNNLTDSFSSFVTIIGTKLSNKKPNKKHPFGFGRIEYISTIIVAIVILIAGLLALIEGINKIINPSVVEYSILSIILVIVAIIVKGLLSIYVRRKGVELNSKTLEASGVDAGFDVLLTLSTLVGALAYMLFKFNVDGYITVFISLIIMINGIQILVETISSIIGVRVSGEIVNKLKSVLLEYEEVKGVYDITLHSYGLENIIGSVHIEVDDELTAKEIHTLSKKLEYHVYTMFGIIITIGIYASNSNDRKALKIKKSIETVSSKYKEIKEIHGFYYDFRTNNVTFDLVIDFSNNREEIINLVKEELEGMYPNYNFYITLDSDYSG